MGATTSALAATDKVTCDWLTQALREGGVLSTGAVLACDERNNGAFNSTIVHLTLTYSDDAPYDAPRRLLLKRNLDIDWAVESARDEAAFYQTVMQIDPQPPSIVPCYLAIFDAQRRASSLLLADVSASHREPLTRDDLLCGDSIPDETALHQAIDALADVHAYWWGRPELDSVFPLSNWTGDEARFTAHVERRQREWQQFLAAEDTEFPDDLRPIYDHALARLPGLWHAGLGARMSTPRRLTLAHGDCYLTQFLVPREGVTAPTYLVDFQSATVDMPSFDLSLMLAAFCSREQRQHDDHELRSLRRYHDQLLAAGVRDYTWDDLLAEYQLALSILLFYPVWDETNGSPRTYWLPKMRCLAAAYEDHCMIGPLSHRPG
ncbi:MAG TPA: phosphotransferase [Ktedonobacterales bacterium]